MCTGTPTLANLGFSCLIPELYTSMPNAIRTVACGSWHILALSHEGLVFSWGCNAYGQLGTGDKLDQSIPSIVRNLYSVNVIGIACGVAHSLCVSGTETIT